MAEENGPSSKGEAILMRFHRLGRFLGGRLTLAMILVCGAWWLGASQSMGAQRDLKEIPVPDPAAERGAMELAEEVEVNLFASDPRMFKPIAMQFGPDGKLWVASSSVYPQLAPGEVANDQIIRLEDSDGDGVVDQHTVFVDKLLIPTGLLPDLSGTGVYVAASTQLLHFQDTDGDGKADRRRLILSGFGTEDTHHMLHTLRWGPDGWLYMNQSIYIHSHVETAYGTKHLDGGGIWRYQPSTGRLEVVCKGFVNPWGHVFDAVGMEFATDGAYGEGINYVFDGSVFVTSPGAERWLSGLNPGSPKHCGLEVLSGRHIPEGWQGNMITHDFRSHRVCRFTLSKGEQGYASQQQGELIRSKHIAFRPIDCKMGPDGALYVADWYNPIIQHGEVDFRDPRRDRTHGRIWRITWKGRALESDRYQRDASVGQLFKNLEHPQESIRQWSRLRLAEHPWEKVQAELRAREASPAEGAWGTTGLSLQEHRRLESFRVHLTCDRWNDGLVSELVSHPNPRVQSVALMMASREPERWKESMEACQRGIASSDWQVRLASAIALRKMESREALAVALTALKQPVEPNLDFVLWSLIREREGDWSSQVDAAKHPWVRDPRVLAYVGRNAKGEALANYAASSLSSLLTDAESGAWLIDLIAAKGDAVACGKALEILVKSGTHSPSVRSAWLNGFLDRTSQREMVPNGAAELMAGALQDGSLGDVLEEGIYFGIAKWNLVGCLDKLVTYLEKGIARGERSPRLVATLQAMQPGSTKGAKDFLQRVALQTKVDSGVRQAALRAIGRDDVQLAARLYTSMIKQSTGGERANAAGQMAPGLLELVQRPGGAEALQASLATLSQIDPEVAKRLLELGRGKWKEGMVETLNRLGGLKQNAWAWSEPFRDEVLALAASQGNAERGEKLFRQNSLQCLRCHPLGSNVGLIGPNLISLGGSAQADYILESLIVPAARLKEGFETIQVTVDDGTSVVGLLRSRTDSTLTLLTAEGKTVDIPRDAIEAEKTGGSLMPSGLVDSLARQELADLVRFLSELGKDPKYSIRDEKWVRAVRFWTLGDGETMQESDLEKMASEPEAGVWSRSMSQVDGSWPIAELPLVRHGETQRWWLVGRLRVECQQSGTFVLSSEELGLQQRWLDGRKQEGTAIPMTAGMHELQFAVEVSTPVPFRIQLRSDDGGTARVLE